MGTGKNTDRPAISRRTFLRSAASLAGVSLLAACGGAAAPAGGGAASGATAAPAQGGTAQVTVEWWDSQTGVDEETTKKMIDTF